MSSNRSPRISRRDAERLLTGGAVVTDATRPLAALLRAASVPAHPAELSGERAVLAAFEEAAQLAPVPSPRRHNVLKSTLAKILTVKVAALVATAAGTSGVVLAATSGVLLPGDKPSDPRPADHPPAIHSSAHSPAGTPRDEAPRSGQAPSPSPHGLCNAYQADKRDDPGKALDSPAFRALVTAAGGRDNVDDYCETVSAAQDADRPGRPTDLPNDSDHGPGDSPATKPAAPTSRGNAPDNSPATGTADSPDGVPSPPVRGS